MSRFQALKQGTKTFSYEDRSDSTVNVTTDNSGNAYGDSLKAIQHSLVSSSFAPKVNDEETLQKKKEKQNQVRKILSSVLSFKLQSVFQ